LRAKNRKIKKIFIPFLISTYANLLLKKSPKFQSNVQVRPIMEGLCFRPEDPASPKATARQAARKGTEVPRFRQDSHEKGTE
jgi:hypothetical protein